MGKDFIAPELEAKVLAHTKLLGPGESDTISFAAPTDCRRLHLHLLLPGALRHRDEGRADRPVIRCNPPNTSYETTTLLLIALAAAAARRRA